MIELVDVSKSFGTENILKEVSYKFESGSRTAVTGPSGSGKTTLLNIIAGLIPLDKGGITIDGIVTDTPLMHIHPSERGIGFVFQVPALWPHMTVKRNILYGLHRLDKTERQERLEHILEVMEISDIINKYPGEISGGQAKRVSLARTLVVKPRCLLLDEPLNNLNRTLKDKVLEVIKSQVDELSTTLIYVTHDTEEVKGMCDNILHLADGKLKTLTGRGALL